MVDGLLVTLFNAIMVVIGGTIGFLFRKKIKTDICNTVIKVIGVVVLIFGIGGVLRNMIIIDSNNNQLVIQNEILLLITLSLGTLIGTILKLNERVNLLGDYFERKLIKDEKEKGSFSKGFITASLLFCVGAMTIIGSIQAATGDPSTIYLKSAMDGITSVILASTLGYGVIFSSLFVFVYQGLFVLLAYFVKDFMLIEEVKQGFNMVGYSIILMIGINFLITEEKNKVKFVNALPALILIILYYIFKIYVI